MATLAGTAAAPDAWQTNVSRKFDVTFSASYATGGESIPVGSISGLSKIYCAHVTVKTPGAAGVVGGYYDCSTNKLKALTATAEVANATNLSGVVCEVVFVGQS